MDGNDPAVVYVGRPSNWGNPFLIGRDGTREEVIAKYREYLQTSDRVLAVWIRANVHQLRGRTLACWCAPAGGFKGKVLCHGQILAGLANGVPPECIE